MPNLAEVTTPIPRGEGSYVLNIPTGWEQGRGAYGGLVMGALARSILLSEQDPERTLRSLTGTLPGPALNGTAILEVQALRRGHGASTWSAMLMQSEGVAAQVTAVLGKTRPHAPQHRPSAPNAPDWRSAPILSSDLPFVPAFARNFEFRPTGPAPFSGGPVPETSGWIQPRMPVPLGAAEIVACSDVWWPAAFSTENAPRPAATIAFTLELLALPETTDPLFHRGRVIAQTDGYMVEFRELWSATGQLLALNQQTIVWIR